MSLTDRISGVLENKLTRRNFLVRAAFAGSALATGGVGYALRPGTAYAAVCDTSYCGNPNCSCDSTCCSGFTEFCCVLNGYNSCPEGTVMGGWWLAEGSRYCDGPRYYMDCNAVCRCDTGCGGYYDGGYTFCDFSCDGLTCECAGGNCGNYLTGCFQFRYGQCNQDVKCTGRIHCRVVTCVPPWEFEDCTQTQATDDGTADQTASCVTSGPTYPPPPCPSPRTDCATTGIAPTATNKGYRIITSFGEVIGFGSCPDDSVTKDRSTPVVAILNNPQDLGFWALDSAGKVIAQSGAGYFGDALDLHLQDPFTAMAVTPNGRGYWLLNNGGNVKNYGDAANHGNALKPPVEDKWIGIAPTPTGKGYWLANTGGRVDAYGDAINHGDALSLHLEDPIVAIASNPAGGYWLCSSGGRVLNYGPAKVYGSPVKDKLPSPIVGMAPTSSGDGYYLVSKFGYIYTYGNAVYHGNAA
jgi:hypothetical protein